MCRGKRCYHTHLISRHEKQSSLRTRGVEVHRNLVEQPGNTVNPGWRFVFHRRAALDVQRKTDLKRQTGGKNSKAVGRRIGYLGCRESAVQARLHYSQNLSRPFRFLWVSSRLRPEKGNHFLQNLLRPGNFLDGYFAHNFGRSVNVRSVSVCATATDPETLLHSSPRFRVESATELRKVFLKLDHNGNRVREEGVGMEIESEGGGIAHLAGRTPSVPTTEVVLLAVLVQKNETNRELPGRTLAAYDLIFPSFSSRAVTLRSRSACSDSISLLSRSAWLTLFLTSPTSLLAFRTTIKVIGGNVADAREGELVIHATENIVSKLQMKPQMTSETSACHGPICNVIGKKYPILHE